MQDLNESTADHTDVLIHCISDKYFYCDINTDSQVNLKTIKFIELST